MLISESFEFCAFPATLFPFLSFPLLTICTDCGTAKKPRDQSQYEALLKRHADTYPTG